MKKEDKYEVDMVKDGKVLSSSLNDDCSAVCIGFFFHILSQVCFISPFLMISTV